MTRVVGVVLAAGSGSRLGGPKAELTVHGIRLLDRAIGVLSEAGCVHIVAVVRPGTPVAGAIAVTNEDPDRGMRSSLALGIDAASDLSAEAVAVLLVDTPGISADAARSVIQAWRPGRIAVASYGGRRGHPIVMARRHWRRAVDLAGPDEGARTLLRVESAAVDEIAVDGDPTDLDTPEDVATWVLNHDEQR